MNRNSIIRSLALASVLALVGCFAEPTSTEEVARSEEDVASGRVVVFERSGQGSATKAVLDHVATHPTSNALGPQPDPWMGEGEGPQPDPWQPHTHRGAPPGGDPTDPSNVLPSTSTPTGGAGGSSSSSNNK